MIKNTETKQICKNCGKEFILVTEKYPTYLEGRSWDTFYTCPYCDVSENIHLPGNEDVKTRKIED